MSKASAAGDPLQHGPAFSRRKFIRYAGATGAAFVLPAALVACGDDEEPAGAAAGSDAPDAKKAGAIYSQVHTLADEFFKAWLEGHEAAAAALGVGTKRLFHNFEPARELSQVNSVKATGGAGLIALTSGPEQEITSGKICQEKGVYFSSGFDVPLWFSPQDVGDKFVNILHPSTKRAAEEVATHLFEQMGGEGEFIHLQGRKSLTDSWRTLGVDAALKKFPKIKLARRISTDWTREAGRKTTLNVLGAFPNAKGIFAQSDAIALGVLSVLKERNMKDMKVVGMDGIPEILSEFDGPNFVGTSANVGFWMAGFSVVLQYDVMNGWKPKDTERILSSGSILTTNDDVDKVRKLYETRDDFDWKKMSRTLNPDDWDPQFPVFAGNLKEICGDFDENKDRMNPLWDKPEIADEIKEVDAMYASHWKGGPVTAAGLTMEDV